MSAFPHAGCLSGLVEGMPVDVACGDGSHAGPVHLLPVVGVSFRVAPHAGRVVEHDGRVESGGDHEAERVRMPVSYLFACLVERFRVRQAGAVEPVGDEPARVRRVDEHGRRALPDFEEWLIVHDGSGYASRTRGDACAGASMATVSGRPRRVWFQCGSVYASSHWTLAIGLNPCREYSRGGVPPPLGDGLLRDRVARMRVRVGEHADQLIPVLQCEAVGPVRRALMAHRGRV